jgi:microcystin-dependent protein
MPYVVNYTESSNPSKPAITVNDQSLNTDTSITFVGQNYNGYAPVIAGDLLHLLENFANPTAPANPVQGQLWYDNYTSLLKVYDGTTWVEAGALKRSSSVSIPSVESSTAGDLWVDTTNSQLYLFSGSSWILVGPQFSQGSMTGPVAEDIVDNASPPITHSVISLYSSGSSTASNRICIISKDTFTPKTPILGFATINQGVNLSTVDSASTTSLSRFWGTASAADALLINNAAISSSNFLRSDVASLTSYPLTIQNNAGLTIGTDASFTIGKSANSVIFNNLGLNSGINFNLNNAGTANTVVYISPAGKLGVGVGNINPASTLDVNGIITASTSSGGINVLGTTDSTSVGTGSVITSGGLSVGLNSSFGGNITNYGKIFLNNLSSGTTGTPTAGSVILPGQNASDTSANHLYDIGSATQQFRNIYAQNFVGTFNGNFTGSLSGNVQGGAAKLSQSTQFLITGDVVDSTGFSFNGQTTNGRVTFNTTLSTSFIDNKTVATDTYGTDEILINRPGASGSTLLKQTKSEFLSDAAFYTIPVGTMMPFAGPASKIPAGYLLCDGSEVLQSIYSALFGVIGYLYKDSSLLVGGANKTFALPDFRGRFPLGADNMNNGLYVPSKSNANIEVSAGGGTAARVTDPTASVVGAASGLNTVILQTSNLPDHKHSLNTGSTQYFAVGLPNPSSTDSAADGGLGLSTTNATNQGYGLPNSSGIAGTTTTSQPITIMNPYQTVNYIIFTGVL